MIYVSVKLKGLFLLMKRFPESIVGGFEGCES